MGRPIDYSALPEHPAVGRHYKKVMRYGHSTVVADVTCPICSKVRSFPLYTLRQQMSNPWFDGKCRTCGTLTTRDNVRATLRKKYAGHKRVVANGYVAINASAIPDADVALFESMRGSASYVLEHRLVMAKHLGRPLESWELVDHMDGTKTNNRIDNLRLYVKGKNAPGSICGHGTYYHEWQMALTKLRELEQARK